MGGFGRRRGEDAFDAEHRVVLGFPLAVRLARELVDAQWVIFTGDRQRNSGRLSPGQQGRQEWVLVIRA